MKLSELKLEDVLGKHMHENEQDYMVYVGSQEGLDRIKAKLTAKFGDVDIVINPDEDWFNVVKITSQNWIDAFMEFGRIKQAWCDKYGCD